MAQYIVISVSEERKQTFIRQHAELGCTIPYVFLPNPATPVSAAHYLSKGVPESKIMDVCCSLSHLRAIEYACSPDAPEFSIILEDDVAFHKTLFEATVHELISKWDSHVRPDKIASIGWIPCRPYDTYVGVHSTKSLAVTGSKILADRYVPGLQAYMIRKEDFIPVLRDLIHPTYEQYDTHMKRVHPHITDTIATDYVLNRAYGQAIVFPPMAIEQRGASSLGHTNHTLYWEPFFAGHESKMAAYYSFDVADGSGKN